MINIVLFEPENSGNIGAVARAMANFDLDRLFLVNPKADHLSDEALARSKHAKKILKSTKIIDKKSLYKFDCVIATTAKTGTDYNIPRSPLYPSNLAEMISGMKKSKNNIAILFGGEGKGLSNNEIQKCDFVVKIDSAEKYGTLNLSHAAAIIFYELFKLRNTKKVSKVEYANNEVKSVLLKKIENVMGKLEFSTKDKKLTQKKVWKRIIGKSFMTKREAFALIGFFKKILKL